MTDKRDALKAEVERLRDSRTRHLETETKLAAEVERLTREMAQLQRFKWNDEQMRLADARAEDAERKADREFASMSAQINELVCAKADAERKLAMAAEALQIALAYVHPKRTDFVDVESYNTAKNDALRARATLAELEKADG